VAVVTIAQMAKHRKMGLYIKGGKGTNFKENFISAPPPTTLSG
jgi:hypothetical protein